MTASCAAHPSRPAAGLCPRCRAPFCEGCARAFEGRRYCLRCAQDLGRAARIRTRDDLARPAVHRPDPVGPVVARSAAGVLLLLGAVEAHRRGWTERAAAAAGEAASRAREAAAEARDDVATSDPLAFSARIEMEAIYRALAADRITRGRLPDDMEAFVRSVLEVPPGRAAGRDPWGGRYRATAEKDRLRLASAGPDLRFGTGDDLVLERNAPAR